MFKNKRVLVTGGAGFIGSCLVTQLLKDKTCSVCVVDNLTYASYQDTSLNHFSNYNFFKQNIADKDAILKIFKDFCPDIVFHLAAESHVDNSIIDPTLFIETNIQGTFNLLQASVQSKVSLFCHVSTDEVYGDLTLEQPSFTEENNYRPSSPYSASKASADHLVRAWNRTYGLPVIVTNCSNNYGPKQHPEKLIPKIIANYLLDKSIPIYGNGQNIRSWLYVNDHVDGLLTVADKGVVGETYNIGNNYELTNLQVALLVIDLLDAHFNQNKDLLMFVNDRPGHDFRYSINSDKIKNTLGWQPKYSFLQGLDTTIKWYLQNQKWLLSKL